MLNESYIWRNTDYPSKPLTFETVREAFEQAKKQMVNYTLWGVPIA